MSAKADRWVKVAIFVAAFAVARKQKPAARPFPPRLVARTGGREPSARVKRAALVSMFQSIGTWKPPSEKMPVERIAKGN